jgi:fructose-bisphosphate aldolase class II/tagatose 1,6-diphosphate aldolase GatY/KbaY
MPDIGLTIYFYNVISENNNLKNRMINSFATVSTLHERFAEVQRSRRALLATNFYNFETLRGVVLAAKAARQPLILQLTQASIDYMGLKQAVSLARTEAAEQGVEAWLHLDHGNSADLAFRCLDAGFDSVMIDASEQAFAQNIKITRQVVETAQRCGVWVEAELGYVAKLGQSDEKIGFTDPEEARIFVEETGVNALAVAIGTVHGFYKGEPKLDLERLSAIQHLVFVPLVLHGGSGIPDAMLQAVIQRGICKVNVATEIKNIFIKILQTELQNTENIDLRTLFPPAIQAVRDLVKQKIDIVSNIVH